MAIQDDWTIDYVDRKITYTGGFTADRPNSIYTVNQLYSYLQDVFDEPAQMDDTVPMSAQTPTQYTIGRIQGATGQPWFIDNESTKALYGGSIQTTGWTKASAEGITMVRWTDASITPPTTSEIGEVCTGGTSTATGTILAVDATRQVVWLRNTSAAQFTGSGGSNENITSTTTDFNSESYNGVLTGETIWANLFSVGSLQANTEVYVGQEDDYAGGRAFHNTTAETRLRRRIEKVDEWWDSDVDFFTGSPNLLGGIGHFDILIPVRESGGNVEDSLTNIDGGRLAIFARQFSKIYSHFELVGGVGNFVVPFASTGADINSQEGPYNVGFDAGAGGKGQLDVGDILENFTGTPPVGRLRAVVTAVTGTTSGDFDYYLIGENEDTTNERTLVQFSDNENINVRGNAFNFDIDAVGTPVSSQGPAVAAGVSVTFADAQFDINEDSTDEEYACTIDCSSQPLADVYKRVMFLTCRGNQDGTVADTQDLLLPSEENVTDDEAGEFYRAVGDITFDWDANGGTGITEGNLVLGTVSGATGVVVSATANGATGTAVLTQVKGTFVNSDNVGRYATSGTNYVSIEDGTITTIVDNTGAPFGTFAGGRWFVAQGVVLTNVPTSDANNWETVDLAGNRIAPPTTRSITFGGLEANDRAAIFEVTAANGTDVKKNQDTVGAIASVSDTSITLSNTVELDVPATGWIRVVDADVAGQEYRYEYSSVSGTTVTFRTGAGLSGTQEVAGASTTVLVDTGAFASFGTDGDVKIGMMIRDTTTGGWAVVLRKIDNDSIETTPISSGSWATTNGWEANQIVVALATPADTVYFPYIDDVASGAELSKNVKYVADTNLVARARFSDPDIGGQRILPFQQTGITLQDADLSVTAIRTDDEIAS